MSREIEVDERSVNLTRWEFDIRQVDGVTPALGETGGQPQISINNDSWTNDGIDVLVSTGNGRYYAQCTDLSLFSIVDRILLSRYKSLNTAETPGETLIVVPSKSITFLFDPGESDLANSYVSLTEADNYFATELHTDDWDCATPEDKVKALIMATRAIDRLDFGFYKTLTTQALQFPRNGLEIIPTDIKVACCLIAKEYLKDIDMEAELANLNVISEKFSSISDIKNRNIVDEAIRAGIPSRVAWTYIKPYLNDPYKLVLNRL